MQLTFPRSRHLGAVTALALSPQCWRSLVPQPWSRSARYGRALAAARAASAAQDQPYGRRWSRCLNPNQKFSSAGPGAEAARSSAC